MKTSFIKNEEKKKLWVLVDAKGIVLGRLASFLAIVLRGKDSPQYTPFVDHGKNVVVINASQMIVTGNKFRNKKYYRHTGYPGGIRVSSYLSLFSRDPAIVLKKAVKGMLPKESPLARKQMKNLRVYSDSDHKHQGQILEEIQVIRV